MMKKIIIGGKVFLLLIGGFLILMAVDVFDMNLSLLEKIGGFLISASPGVALIVFVYFFWNKTKYLGIGTLLINTGFLILFKFLNQPRENIIMILIMIIPLYIIGILFLIDSKKR